MKKIDWKVLSITSVVCLLPILFGVIFYEKLPVMMPVHFNFNNEVDRYASKNFALFGIPSLMLLLQIFCCVISDIRGSFNEKTPKFITIVKWMIPILSVVISVIMIEIPLGSTVDVRKSIMLVFGILFMMMGNYMPKMSYEQMKGKIHPMPKDEKSYRKMMRIFGYTLVLFGILSMVSLFFEPVVSFVIIISFVVISCLECVFCLFKL